MQDQERRISGPQITPEVSLVSPQLEKEHAHSFSETIIQYQDVIRKVVDYGIKIGQELDPIRNLDHGEIDNVRYQVVFRSGKQQPVRIILFSFPNGVNGEAVFRQARDIPKIEGFFDNQAIKDIFPEIYLSHRGVLIIECIQGLEEKRSGEAFAKYIKDQEQFEQLVEESFTMIDAILESGLTLHDISPAGGHNIIFDTNASRYRFFDLDTISQRDYASTAEDFFHITDTVSGHSKGDRSDTLFWLKLIKKYREKYPEARMYHEGETSEIWQVDRLNSLEEANQYPSENCVMPNDPAYENYYKVVHWRGAYTQGEDKSKWMPLHKYPQMKRTVTYTDEDFLLACQKGDFELAESILDKNGRKVILTKSVVVERES